MKIVLLISVLVIGAMLPRGVKSQTDARKTKIAKKASQFGIDLFNDVNR